MTAPVRLREATAMDATAIAAIHVETWQTTYAGLVPDDYLVNLDRQERSVFWRELIGRRRAGIVLVAESQAGEAVGFGSCGPRRADNGDLPFAGEVYALYVAPDWQNRGIGRQLLAALFEELCAKGLTSAVIWVLSGNPSRYFYEAMGGQVVGRRKERFAGALLDETAYGWSDLVGWIGSFRKGPA